MELEIGITNSDTFLAESWFSSDISTGYLEDAIAGWDVWYKQQNSPSYFLFQDQKETHCQDDQVDLFPTCSSSITQLLDEGQRKKIAYPFEMVKRGGVEGETALEDINQQMLMRPAKPIPHPVGDCVARPCDSARGFGISGKAVVALTKIHTQGRGSITIIRTRG